LDHRQKQKVLTLSLEYFFQDFPVFFWYEMVDYKQTE